MFFVIDLDRGEQGRRVRLSTITIRPDLITSTFQDTVVFDYGYDPRVRKNYFRKKTLTITGSECM